MTIVTSTVKNAKISPRKLNLVAKPYRETKASTAITSLKFVNKKAATFLSKAIGSAVSNATTNHNLSPDDLFIKYINVGPGKTIKGARIQAKGSVHRIRKRSTNINIVLESLTSSLPNDNIDAKTKTQKNVDVKDTIIDNIDSEKKGSKK